MAACKFDSKIYCLVTVKYGVNPCLTCKRNRGQLALGVFC